MELAPGFFVETGFRRVNVAAILTNEGFVLIDTPPFPDDARRWRDTLAEQSDQPILAIVNTDCHTDRILGNCWFDARVIIAHDDTIARTQNLPSTFLDAAVDSLASNAAERSLFAGAHLRLPNVGFTQRMQLRYGRRPVLLLSMPGPTAGSVWAHMPETRVVFVGDSVLADRHPYISSPCTKRWLDNLTILRRPRFAVDQIVTGRGPLADKSATASISNYLRLARRRVHSLFRAGRPRADTSTLVPELMDQFPISEAQYDRIQRRVKAGLDRIYEEFKLSENNDEPEDF